MELVLACDLQNLPCFGQKLVFGVLEGLRTCSLVFMALDNVFNLFQMVTEFGFIRCKSCGVFAHFLAFEAKVK